MTNNNITHHKKWLVLEIRLDLPSGVDPQAFWDGLDDWEEKWAFASNEEFDDYDSALDYYQDLPIRKSYGYGYDTPNGKLYIHYGVAIGVCEWWTDNNGTVVDNSWVEEESFFDYNVQK